MAETIKGINIVIGAETTGLSKALSDVNKKSKDIQSELRQVERLLKLDPKNTELLAQKQKLLSDAVANTREKLDSLKAAQEQVNQQFAKGEISEGQYRAFQREIAKTEQDLKKFETQLKSMEPTIESFGDKLQKAGDKIGDAGKKMTDAGKNLSMKVTAPLAAAGAAAFKMAADMEDAVGATDQIYKDAADSVKDWADSLDSYYGIAESEALEYANMMGTMLVNIGELTEEQAAQQAQTLIELAGDLTAMYGGTTQDAVRALTGALKGNNTMLDNYGMAVNEAMIKTKALEMGLIAEGEQLDLAGKQAATLALIMEQTGAAQGQAAREAEGASGSMRALATEIKNIATEIGEILLPVITPLISKLKEIAQRFSEMSPETQKTIVLVAGLAAAIGPLLVVLGAMASGLSAIIGILPVLGTVLAALTSPIGLVVAAVAGLGLVWAKWGDDIKRIVLDAISNITERFVAFRDNVTQIMSTLPDTLKRIGSDLIAGLWQGINDRIAWIKEKVTDFGEGIKNTFKSIFGISSPSKVMALYGQYLAEGLANGINKNAAKATGAAAKMAEEINNKVEAIKTAVTKTVEGISVQTQIMQAKFDLWKAKFGETAEESEKFRQEMDLQQAKMSEINQRIEVLAAAYEDMKRLKGETAAETQKLYLELLKEKAAQADLQNQIEKTTQSYKEQTNAIQNLLSSKNRADVELGATMAYIESTGRIPSKSGGGGGLYESATKVQEQREKEKNDPRFQENLQALLDFGMGIEEAVERLRHAERTGTQITQNITINSPTPLSPSETAREIKNASRQLAMEW